MVTPIYIHRNILQLENRFATKWQEPNVSNAIYVFSEREPACVTNARGLVKLLERTHDKFWKHPRADNQFYSPDNFNSHLTLLVIIVVSSWIVLFKLARMSNRQIVDYACNRDFKLSKLLLFPLSSETQPIIVLVHAVMKFSVKITSFWRSSDLFPPMAFIYAGQQTLKIFGPIKIIAIFSRRWPCVIKYRNSSRRLFSLFAVSGRMDSEYTHDIRTEVPHARLSHYVNTKIVLHYVYGVISDSFD